MARIRTIKPEFFRHEILFDAERETGFPLRVAFAGLFTAADREGRFKWAPRQLKLDCLPYDDVDFSHVLHALASRGFIVKYAVDGKEYGAIPSWSLHQVINNKERGSEIPECNEINELTRAPRVDDACHTALCNSQGEGKGREGERNDHDDDDAREAAREAAAKPPLISSEALKLSAEIAKVCGHDPDFVPPEWYGAPYRVQAWLHDAWPPELIMASVREQVAKKRDGPPSRVDYFEKGIASALARANTPLPTVKIIEGQTTEVRRETTGNVVAAADRLVARLAEFDRPAPDFSRTSELRGGTGAPPIRLVSEG